MRQTILQLNGIIGTVNAEKDMLLLKNIELENKNQELKENLAKCLQSNEFYQSTLDKLIKEHEASTTKNNKVWLVQKCSHIYNIPCQFIGLYETKEMALDVIEQLYKQVGYEIPVNLKELEILKKLDENHN